MGFSSSSSSSSSSAGSDFSFFSLSIYFDEVNYNLEDVMIGDGHGIAQHGTALDGHRIRLIRQAGISCKQHAEKYKEKKEEE